MRLSRSLLGRTSFLWAAGFFVVLGADLALRRLVHDRADIGYGAHIVEAYYFRAHLPFISALELGFAVAAAAYFALERAQRGLRRRLLGGAHLVFTLAGTLAIFAPVAALTLAPPPRRDTDPAEALRIWGEIAGAGYVALILGQLFFAAVLLDALRRAPRMG